MTAQINVFVGDLPANWTSEWANLKHGSFLLLPSALFVRRTIRKRFRKENSVTNNGFRKKGVKKVTVIFLLFGSKNYFSMLLHTVDALLFCIL